ncbi:phosphoribosyltransferase [Cryobacterium algoritolerans]|uniref:phosphoribosyltransferase n=1 Tax=Cryobacterium algoritolerans TaxID=1259184 RepID=UPI00187E272E|nr:phosphoribosyltransferase family protein [Cryobacterium algoritolerans]
MAALDLHDPVVYALPRGGVPVAAPISERLHAPLGRLVVGGSGTGAAGRVARRESTELERRRILCCGDRQPVLATGRVAVVVDDGIATGATIRAALAEVRRQCAAQTVIAVPVAPARLVAELGDEADRVVVLKSAPAFWAIGPFYRDFHHHSDAETADLLGEF